MKTIKAETGARYNFTRTMMAKLLQSKSLNLPMLFPIEHEKVNGRTTLAYNLGIATDNPEGVENYLRNNVLTLDGDNGSWEIEVFPTRLHRTDLKQKYPATVCLKLASYIPFCFKDIVDNVSGNHYLSNVYNNGMMPCAIIQFQIPPKYRAERDLEIQKLKGQDGGSIDNRYMSEYDAMLLRKIWVEDQAEELTIYLGHPDQVRLDLSINSYTISPKCVLFRERPLLPKLDVEVVDCLNVRNSIGYQSRCGYKKTINFETARDFERTRAYNEWCEFLSNRTMTRLGAPLNNITKSPDLLMLLLKITVPDELPKGLNIIYFDDLYNKLKGESNDSATTT